jgi:hypothetical protein
VNAALITGLKPNALGIATNGTDLFIVNGGNISEYTMAGGLVNADLVSLGSQDSFGFAVVGADMYVSLNDSNSIAEYTTAGTLVHANLITGLEDPFGLAVNVPEPEVWALAVGMGAGLAAIMRRRRIDLLAS